jgi:hypothetical protein
MSNKYWVVAKEDLAVDYHTWTKGLDYQVIQKEDYFTLASNEGSVNYFNSVKSSVLALFSYKKEQ